MDILVWFLIFGLSVSNGWCIWKLVNVDRNLDSLFFTSKTKIDNIEADLLKIKRAFTVAQAQSYTSSGCATCGAVLPEDTVKSIDGKRYCTKCLINITSQLQKLLDGYKVPEIPEVTSAPVLVTSAPILNN